MLSPPNADVLSTDGTASGTTVLLLLLVVVGVVHWYLSGPSGLPPGPSGVPLVGYLPFLGQRPEVTLATLSKKYGGIVSLYLGSRLVVVLNDYNVIREAFVKQGQTFSGRPTDFNISASPKDKYSLLLTDGQLWKSHRRFATSLLIDFGMGKHHLEPLITNEIKQFVAEVKKYGGRPTDFRSLLKASMANTITLMVLGKRFDYGDPWMEEFIRFVDLFVQGGSTVAIFTFFPWTRHVPGVLHLTNQTELVNTEDALNKNMAAMLQEYKQRHRDGARDNYVNAFICEQKERARTDPNDDTFQDEALLHNTKIMLTAGVETTATTIAWLILYLTRHPRVLERVRREVDEVIGAERTPSYADRARTPYTEATIHEVQRIATLGPLAAPHRNLRECHLNGHRIPKDTYILVNLWSVHNDERLFNNPNEFRPERFLHPKTGEFARSEYVIPFSLGQRQCLGEALARMELYLYLTCLVQSLDIRPIDGVVPSLEAAPGIAVGPKEFMPCLIPRNCTLTSGEN